MRDGKKLPTTTACQSRVRLFQPTHRPTRIDEEFRTIWGTCRVRGRLGQRHADVLESILFFSPNQEQDGRLILLVDPAKIRRTISDAGYSGEALENVMDDLTEVLLVVRTQWVQTTGHLIDSWRKSTSMTAANPLGGHRNLWVVTVGDALIDMMKADHCFNRAPGAIPLLKNGICKAVVRHCMTHRFEPSGGWKLDELVRLMCPNASSSDFRNRRRDIREESAGIERCGFMLADDRLRKITSRVYSTPDGVYSTPDGV